MVPHIHVSPGQNLELARLHHPPNVYPCLGQSLQILLAIRGLHYMGSFFTPIEAVLIEGAKHPVLLVQAIEERTNVSVRSDAGACTPQGIPGRRHLSPPLST